IRRPAFQQAQYDARAENIDILRSYRLRFLQGTPGVRQPPAPGVVAKESDPVWIVEAVQFGRLERGGDGPWHLPEHRVHASPRVDAGNVSRVERERATEILVGAAPVPAHLHAPQPTPGPCLRQVGRELYGLVGSGQRLLLEIA